MLKVILISWAILSIYKLIKQKILIDELKIKNIKMTNEKSKLSNSVRTKGILVDSLERANKRLKNQIED